MKLIKLFIIIVSLILFTFCGKGPVTSENEKSEKNESQASLINKKIILEIKDKNYSNSDFKLFMRFKYSDIKDISSNDKILSRLLDSFIENSMILYNADNSNTTVSKTEIHNYLEKNNIQKKSWSYSSISDFLKVQKYLYSKIYKDISVSDHEINQHYRNNIKKFKKKAEIELYQILLKNREEAIKIRGELLNSPGKFGQLAETVSISPERSKKGYMGKFESGNLPKDIDKVVFSLGINMISRVFESQFGFHIFKVTKRRGGRQLYLNNVKEDIKKELINKKILYEYDKFFENLRKNLNIKLFYKNLFFKYISIEGDSNENKDAITLNYITDINVKHFSKS